MAYLNQSELLALEATATTAAAYLDACDGGAKFVRLDPAYYQACGKLLMSIFTVANPQEAFSILLEHSPAARNAAESVQIAHRIEVSRAGYYPHLSVVLNRASV